MKAHRLASAFPTGPSRGAEASSRGSVQAKPGRPPRAGCRGQRALTHGAGGAHPLRVEGGLRPARAGAVAAGWGPGGGHMASLRHLVPPPVALGAVTRRHLLISQINSTMINVMIYSTNDQNHCIFQTPGQ